MKSDQDPIQLQPAFEELKNINSLLDKICRVRETNHIMSILIDELVRLSGATEGVVNLITEEDVDTMMTIVRSRKNDPADIPYRVSDSISGWVLKNQLLLKIDNLDTDERFSTISSEDGRFKSVVCCPLIARGKIIGLASLVRNDKSEPFNEDECRLIGIIGSQSAQLLYNALLLEELARKNALLAESYRKLREEHALLKTEVAKNYSFENIIGKSEQIKQVLRLISKVCSNDSPVLITGPTGTGKELVARAIHYNSQRKDRPFVVKNCGVKTETLLESELFGHIKGAFTGADRSKPGLFREADGGTIFLDEVGDAPLSTQVAILRAIENGEIRPVGASKSERVDVRVLSATNKDLKSAIKDNSFREDLFYRLNTVTIDNPPLAHRTGDIPLLVHHLMNRLRVKLQKENLAITPGALSLLEKYSWPGNIRQLENEIERAALVCDIDGVIDVEDFSAEVKSSSSEQINTSGYHGKLRDAVNKLEIDLIKRMLAETDGNILKSSKLLGLTRKGLKDKIARYGITSEESN